MNEHVVYAHVSRHLCVGVLACVEENKRERERERKRECEQEGECD